MLSSPLRFDSYLRPTVWGAQKLSDYLHKSLPDNQCYGEAWDISDHASHRSTVLQGLAQGLSIRDLMTQHCHDLLGPESNAEIFPLLIKYLDANEWLSVQVHPNDENVAALRPGEGGKTEAWLVLQAEPDSRIYAGLRPGVTETVLRNALAEGTVADCLCSFAPVAGQCFFLPAGTVHAVGGGVLMAEVQQTSDATFRLFDWNRRDAEGKSRELHIEEAMAATDWDQGEVAPITVPDFTAPAGKPQEIFHLVDCPYFTMQYARGTEAMEFGGRGCAEILMVLEGNGKMVGDHSEDMLTVGTTWLLPASMDRISCQPNKSLGMLHVII